MNEQINVIMKLYDRKILSADTSIKAIKAILSESDKIFMKPKRSPQKLSDDLKSSIIMKLQSGESVKNVAKQLGVPYQIVYHYKKI